MKAFEEWAAMPSQVRIFFGLSAAVVGYWVSVQAWYWLVIAPYIAFSGMLDAPQVRAIMVSNVETLILAAIPLCASIFGLAWMAAFRHRNWARVAFVAVVVLREIYASFYQGRPNIAYYVDVHWGRPDAYWPSILLAGASIVILIGNAHAWFKPRLGAVSDIFT